MCKFREPRYLCFRLSSSSDKCKGGNHGYDNAYKSMQASVNDNGGVVHRNVTS